MDPYPEPYYLDLSLGLLSFKKGSTPSAQGSIPIPDPYKDEPHLDPSGFPFVPLDKQDPYDGPSLLRLMRKPQSINPSITYYPQRGKQGYYSVEYADNYAPPEQCNVIHLPHPTKEKKNEPVQDPVPQVKGIGATPLPLRRSS